ncbi:MAG: hypothetical protein IPO28_13615 [Holophagaceae bacterium]|nr:hypothetical protein [Holophagaceae bacterium]
MAPSSMRAARLAGVENLANGCVCCSLRDDVVATLRAGCDHQRGLRPERVVLEPPDWRSHGPAGPRARTRAGGRLRPAGLLTGLPPHAVDHLRADPCFSARQPLASLVHPRKGDLDPSAAVAWEEVLAPSITSWSSRGTA